MPRNWNADQIVKVLSKYEKGVSVSQLCDKYGMSDTTLRFWRKSYMGLDGKSVERLQRLESENKQLKRELEGRKEDVSLLKRVIDMLDLSPAKEREVVAWLQDMHNISERRATDLIGAARATVRYRPRGE